MVTYGWEYFRIPACTRRGSYGYLESAVEIKSRNMGAIRVVLFRFECELKDRNRSITQGEIKLSATVLLKCPLLSSRSAYFSTRQGFFELACLNDASNIACITLRSLILGKAGVSASDSVVKVNSTLGISGS